METLRYTIFINAPRERVWEAMLGKETYKEWTKEFGPGSHYEGTWEEGTEMRFLAPSEKGEGEMGMVSVVRENREPEYMSLEHVGLIKNGIEDRESEEAKKWAPAFENYTLVEKDGGTEVRVEMDTNEEYKQMLESAWPKALARLKQIAER